MTLFTIKNLFDLKSNWKLYILGLFFTLFIVSSCLYVIKYSIIFPIINASILFVHLFIFKGKYRIYAFVTYIPFIIFFNYKPLGIGSFYTYTILIYCFFVLLDLFVYDFEYDKKDVQKLILCVFLGLYTILISFIFSRLSGFIKSASVTGYTISIAFMCLDKRAGKDKSLLLLLISSSFLLSNFISYSILYIIKGDIAVSFLSNFIGEIYLKKYLDTNNSFRYPGLFADPNYLGFYSLMMLAIYISFFKSLRFKIPSLIIISANQVFTLFGESRNYLVCLIIVIVILMVCLLIKVKNGWLIALGGCGALLVVSLTLGNSILAPTILRIVNIDKRTGLLAALTSDRTTLQQLYLSYYLQNPLVFIFGKGIDYPYIDYTSAHSTFVMTFWYFGIIGTALYYIYLLLFLNFNNIKKTFLYLLPLVVIIMYGFTLDFVTSSEAFLLTYFIYSLFINVETRNNNEAIAE